MPTVNEATARVDETQRPPLIEAKSLSVRYSKIRDKADLIALRDVSLSVSRGEFVAILGPSGCGKTTLLNCVAGLVSPSQGEVRVNGSPVTGPGPDRAMVFQDYALMPWRTVEANVRFGLEFCKRGLSKQDISDRIEHHLSLVGLSAFKKSFPYELSGGMRQRVGLARAMAAEPEVLLADEPFGAVDAMTREAMQAELERIIASTGHTVMLVTHSIDEAVTLADRVVVITNRPGRIREIVEPQLPRPRFSRDSDIKSHPAYVPTREHLWHLLQDEALGAADDE